MLIEKFQVFMILERMPFLQYFVFERQKNDASNLEAYIEMSDNRVFKKNNFINLKAYL